MTTAPYPRNPAFYDGSGFLCLDSQQGHVIYNKHRWIPVLLSAKIDVLWLDFDMYFFRDPMQHIRSLLPDPEKHGLLDSEVKEKRGLPFRFEGVVETRAPDEEHWAGNLTNINEHMDELTHPDRAGTDYIRANTKRLYREIRRKKTYRPLSEPSELGYTTKKQKERAYKNIHPAEDLPDIYVQEHYDALCLNSGVFFVRSSAKTLAFFLEFLRWQFEHPFADNQNGFDAFLGHSCVDSFVPTRGTITERPLVHEVTYGLLDVEKRYLCAEGWNGPALGEIEGRRRTGGGCC